MITPSVLQLFMSGKDTNDIARILRIREHQAYNRLARERDRARMIDVPSWVPGHLRQEYICVAVARGEEEAASAIFGVTCGNDVSERDWQGGKDKDMQWWRAKGADTFGPLGPAIVKGLDYSNVLLTTKVNGQVKQQQSTKDLIFDCPTCLSFISKYVTLEPGDLIYTGTPGTTSKMAPGDVCEVEIEGIGVLKNPIKAQA